MKLNLKTCLHVTVQHPPKINGAPYSGLTSTSIVNFGGLETSREGKSGRTIRQRFRNEFLLGCLVGI